MAQSIAQIYIHFIFHTKSTLIKRPHLEELWSYVAGIARTYGSFVLKVGGEPDHVHMLCTLPRTMSMAEFAEEVKGSSSKWIKTKDVNYRYFHWQRGYAAFSVSQSQVETVTKYIDNQFEHHKKHIFEDEYLEWLVQYKTEFDPKYVLSD